MKRILVGGVLSLLVLASASAQDAKPAPSSGDGAPLSITGFRYEKAPGDLHVYHCENDSCIRGSRVSFRFLAPSDKLMTLDEFRAGQEQFARSLAPRALKVEVLSTEAMGGPQPPAHVKIITRFTDNTGAVEYSSSGMIMGRRAFASLASSSPQEATADANFGLFATGLLLLLNVPSEPQTQPGGSAK